MSKKSDIFVLILRCSKMDEMQGVENEVKGVYKRT